MTTIKYAAAHAEAELHPQNFAEGLYSGSDTAARIGFTALFRDQIEPMHESLERLGQARAISNPAEYDQIVPDSFVDELYVRREKGHQDQLVVSPVVADFGQLDMADRFGRAFDKSVRVNDTAWLPYRTDMCNNNGAGMRESRARIMVLLDAQANHRIEPSGAADVAPYSELPVNGELQQLTHVDAVALVARLLTERAVVGEQVEERIIFSQYNTENVIQDMRPGVTIGESGDIHFAIMPADAEARKRAVFGYEWRVPR